jgi:predicted ribosome quality control (RQC) complex YloA/Tae2 family protein
MTGAREEATSRVAARQLRLFRARLERRMTKIQAELDRFPDPADQRTRADALGAHLGSIRKGMRKVELPDLLRPGEKIELALDPSRTPGENLNQLYQKAQRAERAREALARRLRETRRELEIGPEMRPAATTSGKHKAAGPYRRYISSDGLPIWVGRNGRENDRLLRDARPWDLWLHAREAQGAHVLVRKPGREARVPQRSLIEAAGLAALHSRAAGSGGVEVMVAEVARVSKPKGAPPGRVVVAGERTVRVAPGAGNPRPQHG